MTPIPPDLLPPPGVVLLSRLEASRTPESVARLVRMYGVECVRLGQKRGWW